MWWKPSNLISSLFFIIMERDICELLLTLSASEVIHFKLSVQKWFISGKTDLFDCECDLACVTWLDDLPPNREEIISQPRSFFNLRQLHCSLGLLGCSLAIAYLIVARVLIPMALTITRSCSFEEQSLQSYCSKMIMWENLWFLRVYSHISTTVSAAPRKLTWPALKRERFKGIVLCIPCKHNVCLAAPSMFTVNGSLCQVCLLSLSQFNQHTY